MKNFTIQNRLQKTTNKSAKQTGNLYLLTPIPWITFYYEATRYNQYDPGIVRLHSLTLTRVDEDRREWFWGRLKRL